MTSRTEKKADVVGWPDIKDETGRMSRKGERRERCDVEKKDAGEGGPRAWTRQQDRKKFILAGRACEVTCRCQL